MLQLWYDLHACVRNVSSSHATHCAQGTRSCVEAVQTSSMLVRDSSLVKALLH